MQLSINGVPIGTPILVGSNGQFSSLIATDSSAAVGYYVLAASTGTTTSSLAQTSLAGMDQQSYRLAPDAPLRTAPAGAPTPVAVPPSIPAFERPPVVYLPLVRR